MKHNLVFVLGMVGCFLSLRKITTLKENQNLQLSLAETWLSLKQSTRSLPTFITFHVDVQHNTYSEETNRKGPKPTAEMRFHEDTKYGFVVTTVLLVVYQSLVT